MNKNYFKLFLTALVFIPILLIGVNNIFDVTLQLNFLLGACYLVILVFTGAATYEPESLNINAETTLSPFLKCTKRLTISLAILFILPWTGVKSFYNQSVNITNQYVQKTQELPLFYDMMWKTYDKKDEIRSMNEATFKEIASIMMNARTDGQSITWKWVQENTQIPFTEFTGFYKDLSYFIESKRQQYLNLEIERQNLAAANNTLLKQFPNNFYNIFIGRNYIHYEPGFTSDKTQKVFQNKAE